MFEDEPQVEDKKSKKKKLKNVFKRNKKSDEKKIDETESFYGNTDDDSSSSSGGGSDDSFYSSQFDDMDNDSSGLYVEKSSDEKEGFRFPRFKWWEYLVFAVELILVVYTFLVIIGMASLP